MDNTKTIFRYTYLGNKPVLQVVDAMLIELNEGQAFSRHSTHEEPVRTALTNRAQWTVGARPESDSTIIVEAPDTVFQGPTLTELFTVFWANLQDFGSIRLEDFVPSRRLAETLTQRKGNPILGVSGIRRLLDLPAGTVLLGSILKPSRLMSLAERREQALMLASCGLNLIKEDETYLQGNETVLREADDIQRHLADWPALYVPNISACGLSESFLVELAEVGVRIVMVNALLCGWSWLAQLVELSPGIGIWIHRVGYKNVAPTLGMLAWLRALRLAGADLAHIGTPWVDQGPDIDEARLRIDVLRGLEPGQRDVTPVLTKTTSQTVPRLIEYLGSDNCMLACGALRHSGRLCRSLIEDWVTAARGIGA